MLVYKLKFFSVFLSYWFLTKYCNIRVCTFTYRSYILVSRVSHAQIHNMLSFRTAIFVFRTILYVFVVYSVLVCQYVHRTYVLRIINILNQMKCPKKEKRKPYWVISQKKKQVPTYIKYKVNFI
jgi:hypothetical protein